MSKLNTIAMSFMLLAVAAGDHPISWYRDFEPIPISGDADTRSAETVYRLPENVEPLDYDIYIDLYFDERTEKPYSFEGRETITVLAVEENVTQIVLHANVDSINAVTLLTEPGVPHPLNAIEPFTVEPLYHFLKINLATPLDAGANYSLYIEYSNTMNDGPLKRGIWKGWYIDDDGVERIYAATHFQPYNARQAFPCWDEPLFKAVFRLHLSRPNAYLGTFSNTGVSTFTFLPNNRIRETFNETPKMSSYLVTFLVSETFQVIAEDTSFTPPIRIIGRSNTVGLADHALNLSVKMTEFFDQYFEIPYSTLHPNLFNDHISSPDWASAGTENWGMVSYREMYLIIDPKETIMGVEHYASTLVSHELAHKWFGNLITCYWWSNTWINEGYASYFGYIATHEMFPEYELHEHFNSRYLQNSLSFDSGTGTVPLNHDVNTPSQVTGHFGTISYSKGAAFLRMTSDIITPETFKKVCKIFLEANAFEATDQYDLLNAFEQAVNEDGTVAKFTNFNFSEYYRIWVNEAGYPILNVNVNYETGEISLSQERFFISASATSTGQIYPIPITYSSKANQRFTTDPLYMLTTESAVLHKEAGEEWVIFNNLQHGHYRVNYDDRTWELISEALLFNPASIHHLNRAQVVDDVFALMRSERMTYEYGFRILTFLRTETNFHVWDPAITGYTWLRNRLRHLPESQAIFDAHILSQMEHVINTLGFDVAGYETPTVSLTRQSIMHFACNLGHARCVSDSRSRFVNLRDNNEWVDPRIRRHVYVSGIRQGEAVDFQFLVNRLRQSNYANDQLEMLRGLGAARDPQILTQYLEMTLTNDVRSHDKVNAFNYALLGNQESAYTVLQFVKNNIEAIRETYVEDAPANPVHSALSNLASYLDESGLVEFEDWLRTTQTHIRAYSTAISAIGSARSNMAWGTANVDNILEYIRETEPSSSSKVLTSGVLLFTMALTILNV